MRRLALLKGDIRFQWKYGFYAVYAIFTVVYVLTLLAIPEAARRTVATVMIFTDPAAMGLFFMGAIILLEKSQHIDCALAAAPLSVWEYCAAKLLSLALIGLIVAFILALAGGIRDIAGCLLAVLLTSLLCSACGLIAAEKARSLNNFVLLAVPFELLICLPPALLLFGVDYPAMSLHPGVAAVRLIYGEATHPALCLLSLALWCIPALLICLRTVRRSFVAAGGMKL